MYDSQQNKPSTFGSNNQGNVISSGTTTSFSQPNQNTFSQQNNQLNPLGPLSTTKNNFDQQNLQSNTFGQTNLQTNSFGQPNTQINTLGQPNSQINTLGQPNTQINTLGQPNTQINTLGQPNTQTNTFGQPNTQINTLGQPNQQSYNLSQPTSQLNSYGQINTQSNVLGQTNTTGNSYGQINTRKSVFDRLDTNVNSFGNSNVQGTMLSQSNPQGTMLSQSNPSGAIIGQTNTSGTTIGQTNALQNSNLGTSLNQSSNNFPSIGTTQLCKPEDRVDSAFFFANLKKPGSTDFFGNNIDESSSIQNSNLKDNIKIPSSLSSRLSFPQDNNQTVLSNQTQNNLTLFGSNPANQSFQGYSQNQSLLGQNQNLSNQGNNQILSNQGNNQILSNQGNNQILSNQGNNQFFSNQGNNQILSNQGNNFNYSVTEPINNLSGSNTFQQNTSSFGFNPPQQNNAGTSNFINFSQPTNVGYTPSNFYNNTAIGINTNTQPLNQNFSTLNSSQINTFSSNNPNVNWKQETPLIMNNSDNFQLNKMNSTFGLQNNNTNFVYQSNNQSTTQNDKNIVPFNIENYIKMNEGYKQIISHINLALTKPLFYNDKRDEVIKKLNSLCISYGVSYVFVDRSKPPIEIDSSNPLCRFKSITYSQKPTCPNSDGYVLMYINENLSDFKRLQDRYMNEIKLMLGLNDTAKFDYKEVSRFGSDMTKVICRLRIVDNFGMLKTIDSIELFSCLINFKEALKERGIHLICAYCDIPEEVENRYKNPLITGINPTSWEKAFSQNPDPQNYIPSVVIGFQNLEDINMIINQRFTDLIDKMIIMSTEMTRLEAGLSQIEVSIKLLMHKYEELQCRYYRVIMCFEVIKRHGRAFSEIEIKLKFMLNSLASKFVNVRETKAQVTETFEYFKDNVIKRYLLSSNANSLDKQFSDKFGLNLLVPAFKHVNMQANRLKDLFNKIDSDIKVLQQIDLLLIKDV